MYQIISGHKLGLILQPGTSSLCILVQMAEQQMLLKLAEGM